MALNRVPVLQALILADDVFVDRDTGKKVIAGTFNRLSANNFPTMFSRATKAYVNLTQCQGEFEIQLKWVDLKDESILLSSTPLSIRHDNPLENFELVIGVPPFPMPHPGIFAFELFSGNDRLGALRVSVDKNPD